MQPIKITKVIRLADTDAAGVLFFANQFILAHELYEIFLDTIGESVHDILTNRSYLLPLVHAEADFYMSLSVGDEVTIVLDVQAIGDSSFTLDYTLYNSADVKAGFVRTVHAATDKSTNAKISLPEKLRTALSAFKDIH